MEKLKKIDNQLSHLFLTIHEKVNEIVDYINEKEFAASGSDTSRTTPNNGEHPKQDNPVPSLEIAKKYLPGSNGNSFTFLKDDLVKFCNEIIQYGRTTDKENLKIEMVKIKGSKNINDFYIGKYQVTQAQWKAVMGNNPSHFIGDELPIETVSWNDVQEFLKKLNAQTDLNYRLPTEVEWEYAARGGNQSKGFKYAGSNKLDEVAWYSENSKSKTHPVGLKKPNELGLYDMNGNVWELCEDDWHRNYRGAPINGSAWINSPRGDFRVGRGNSWYSLAQDCRAVFRGYASPTSRDSALGFRLAI